MATKPPTKATKSEETKKPATTNTENLAQVQPTTTNQSALPSSPAGEDGSLDVGIRSPISSGDEEPATTPSPPALPSSPAGEDGSLDVGIRSPISSGDEEAATTPNPPALPSSPAGEDGSLEQGIHSPISSGDEEDELQAKRETTKKSAPSRKDKGKKRTTASQDWATAKVAELAELKDTKHPTEPAAAKITPVVQPPVPVTIRMRHDVSLLTNEDLDLFNQGTHFRLYEKLGSHILTMDGITGTYFAVWAPNAEKVFVTGSFNNWNRTNFPLRLKGNTGIWEGFIEGVGNGTVYKYFIHSQYGGYRVEKADPFAHYAEIPPKSASIVWDMDYLWQDSQWMKQRAERNKLSSPIATYEVHIGSWLQKHDENEDRFLSYRELAPLLADYVQEMGFTHIEFMPVTEHPFYGSWGYQCTGYFAPSSRFGTPQDFMYLVDYLHQRNIGVLIDWVPSHFAVDMHGLSFFDGTHLYEHASPQKGWHPDWNSFIFNHGRYEVRSFLISSALFWLDWFHTDGLRVDAVASMLYLDYSRKEGEWVPNKYGGKENLEAIEFLQLVNEEVYRRFPDVQTIAEESTSWGSVSRPTYAGGLGFGLKWDMGWMHDTLFYMQRDAIHRKYHHDQLTFRMMYAYTENFVLPLSHDEVVHGKGSLLNKMSGDDLQKFANLRMLFCYMYGMPAKKLLFMGAEIAQWQEWSHEESLPWHITEHAPHSGVQHLVKDLNRLYRQEPCLHELDCEPGGFEWIDCHDSENSIVSFIRTCRVTNDIILVVCNFTPVLRNTYAIGVPRGGYWREVLNSDAECYGGSNLGNAGGVMAKQEPHHGRPYRLAMTIPPLSAIFLRSKGAW